MPEESKRTDRDTVLVGILERMSEQIRKQELLLKEIVRQQGENNRDTQSNAHQIRSLHLDNEQSIEKLQETIGRYRSDMLSIVNEQDGITKSMNDLNKQVSSAAYQMDLTSRKLIEIDERLKTQEKTLNDRNEYLIKQTEQIPKDIQEAKRKDEKLHAETESQLTQLHRETQKQLDKLAKDTTRRLLSLNDIESSLQTILIRTEPPEKKSPLIVRFFKKIGLAFGSRFKKIIRFFGSGKTEDVDPK